MRKQLVCLVAALSLLLQPVAASEEQPVVKTVPDVQGMEVGAKAALVMEAGSGRVLFAQNERERLPIASTTKIMTALIALEQPHLDAFFEADTDAIHVEGSSMGLKEGDQVSLRALAVGMLLHSGNDAANAAAVRISGSVPTFVEEMNRRAAQLGMEDTSFETPSGLDGEAHYSTAYDMALLTRAALENPDFAAICSQYRMRATFGNPAAEHWLTNHNKLLNYYEGTYGVKTGFTKKAGRCLVSAAEKDGIRLIVVTLGCPDDWNTHRNLYDAFFPQLTVVDLAQSIPPVTIDVVGGRQNTVSALPLEEALFPMPLTGGVLRWEVSAPAFLYAPVSKGDFLGEARVFLDEQALFTLTLASGEDVALAELPQPEHPPWYDPIVKLFWDE